MASPNEAGFNLREIMPLSRNTLLRCEGDQNLVVRQMFGSVRGLREGRKTGYAGVKVTGSKVKWHT